MKKMFALVLALCMALCAGCAMADAAVKYIERSWNGDAVMETKKSVTSYTEVVSDTTNWDNGWYVVKGNVTIGDRISVSGTVNLILCDGAALTAKNGVAVRDGYTLNIYAQAKDTGRLIATGGYERAGIGSDEYRAGGTITIHGGTIEATGGGYGAGIGGGLAANGGTITIYGGMVTANSQYGAGIGGGEGEDSTDQSGKGGDVTIFGGTVEASGHDAAIGGGSYFYTRLGEGNTPYTAEINQGTLSVSGSVVRMLGGKDKSSAQTVENAQDFLDSKIGHSYAYIQMEKPDAGAADGAADGAAAELPKTGDPSSLMGWVCLLAASGAGLKLRGKKN